MTWCGLLVVDKPTGITSRAVVDRVQTLVRPAKVGHAGTLDPLATGVLVVCVGAATRLITHIQQGRKRYVGRFLLGKRSSTDDVDGDIIDGSDWSSLARQQLEDLLPEFTGTILQTPPQISAVKVEGHRAYKLARRGLTVDIEPRPVDVFSLRLTQFSPPEFELEIECGSGTYIRSIGRDIGERLKCGAIMSALRREAVGSFTTSAAIPFDSLNREACSTALLPPTAAVAHLPWRELDAIETRHVREGRFLPIGELHGADQTSTDVALCDSQRRLIGVGGIDRSLKQLRPQIILPVDRPGLSERE